MVGCGQSVRQKPEQKKVLPNPVAVVLETEIKGRIKGQSLRDPAGLAVDRHRVLYLVDAGNNRLIRFDRDLVPEVEIGGYGSQPGLFNQPLYVSIDNDLNVLISDVGNRRISRHDGKLNYVDEIDFRDNEDPLKFGRPSGVAVTAYGEVWICDRENNRIAIFDNIGRFDRFVGDFGYSGGELRSPEKLIIDQAGRFYVCDAGNARIVLYDEFGNFIREIINPAFDYPQALAVDSHGLIWVIDRESGTILCVDPAGILRLTVGVLIPGCREPMKNPADLAFTGDGRLVISDAGNHRLLVCRVIHDQP
jgi:streptogramin lyase